MRINLFVAKATGMSRRSADTAIADGRVLVNGCTPKLGDQVLNDDLVYFDNRRIYVDEQIIAILLHKPVGYVCSRKGQGSKTVYDLVPKHYHRLKPIGRLDKDSSGLLIMTNDGQLAHKLGHPSFEKEKHYRVTLDRPLDKAALNQLQAGVPVKAYTSCLQVSRIEGTTYYVQMYTGKNRQIRKTFAAIGYHVTHLHRTDIAHYSIVGIKPGGYRTLVQ